MTCPIQLLMAKLGLHPVSLAPEACQVETSHDAPSQNFSKQVKKGGGWFSQIIRSPSCPAGIQSEPTRTPPATMQGESVLSTQLVKGKDMHFRHKI